MATNTLLTKKAKRKTILMTNIKLKKIYVILERT